MKTYLPNGVEAHVGSSGFTNYWRCGDIERDQDFAARVLSENPGCVIVDGSDDWSRPPWRRPERFCHDLEVSVVARFHTGVSGISSSGVVLTMEEYEKAREKFPAAYEGRKINDCVRVYG